MDKSKKGVYCIINLVNYKKYIGSTIDSFKKRWWNHEWSLNNKKHKNQHLQNAWNKYGKENFLFSIIEIIEDDNQILEKEQYWINQYEFKTLYNINPFATGGTQFSEDIIQKRAKTNKLRSTLLVEKYKLWKNGKILDDDLTLKEKYRFSLWVKEPWNKGKKYKSTEHLKVPKKKKGNRLNDKLTKRTKLPEVEVYDLLMNYIMTFQSAKDLEDWSLTEDNNLPIEGRFNKERMGKPLKLLMSCNVNKSCKTGKPYKGLFFKYKQSPSIE